MSSRRFRKGLLRGRRKQSPGTVPGTLPATTPQTDEIRTRLLGYGPTGHETSENLEDLERLRQAWPVLWVEIVGSFEGLLEDLARRLRLHRLALEDAAGEHQRPKIEDYGDQLFIVARLPVAGQVTNEQWNCFVVPGLVVSLHRRMEDPFAPIRQRILGGLGRIRQAGADWLAYALLDCLVDRHFPVIEDLAESAEQLEESVLSRDCGDPVPRIAALRRELWGYHRDLVPLREALVNLHGDQHPLLDGQTLIGLRDCLDHVAQLIDLVDGARNLLGELIATWLAMATMRTNEIMRILTVWGAIFLPLNLIAAIYGMNFDPDASPWNMPELRWSYGYPFALALMAAIAGLILLVGWRKGWISRR